MMAVYNFFSKQTFSPKGLTLSLRVAFFWENILENMDKLSLQMATLLFCFKNFIHFENIIFRQLQSRCVQLTQKKKRVIEFIIC